MKPISGITRSTQSKRAHANVGFFLPKKGRKTPFVVAICGGSCSGKTTLALQFRNACVVSMDDFYLGKAQMLPPYNFDRPDASDLKVMAETIGILKNGAREVTIPKYNMRTSDREGTKILRTKPLIVVEGIFSLYTPALRKLADLKIYLDVDLEERVKRRLKRDVIKGRSAIQSLEWGVNVERMHGMYVEPQKRFADICVTQFHEK